MDGRRVMKCTRFATLLCAIASAAMLAGCGAFGGGAALSENAPGVMRGGATSAAAAQAAVRVGANKSEVSAAMGRANVIPFPSGWEVWVYRWPGAGRSTSEATELVVLFNAAGQVAKTRVRTGERSG